MFAGHPFNQATSLGNNRAFLASISPIWISKFPIR
jgi:hypothetical protein